MVIAARFAYTLTFNVVLLSCATTRRPSPGYSCYTFTSHHPRTRVAPHPTDAPHMHIHVHVHMCMHMCIDVHVTCACACHMHMCMCMSTLRVLSHRSTLRIPFHAPRTPHASQPSHSSSPQL